MRFPPSAPFESIGEGHLAGCPSPIFAFLEIGLIWSANFEASRAASNLQCFNHCSPERTGSKLKTFLIFDFFGGSFYIWYNL